MTMYRTVLSTVQQQTVAECAKQMYMDKYGSIFMNESLYWSVIFLTKKIICVGIFFFFLNQLKICITFAV